MIEPILLSIEGHEKTFKTTTAYTGPLPIVGFQFDMGIKRAIYGTKFDDYFNGLDIEIIQYDRNAKLEDKPWRKHDITIFELPPAIQLDPKHYVGTNELWNYFMVQYVEAMGDDYIHTGVIDTNTLAQRTKRDAHLQVLQEIGAKKTPKEERVNLIQIEYGASNDAMHTVFTTAKTFRKNLITVHHLKETYVPVTKNGVTSTEWQGAYELEGYKNTYQAVDIAIKNNKTNGMVETEILKCGWDVSLEGSKSMVPLTWDMLMGMVESKLGGRIEFEKRQQP